MVISKFLKSNMSDDGSKELTEKLRQEARMLFFDKMMYDINDALTSILAACDVEGRDAIPKVKQYIHRINQSLNNTKDLQINIGDKKFNISSVLNNLIQVLKNKFKEVKLACIISDIKAPVYGDQSDFEKLLLYIFINLIHNPVSQNSEILIELRQKDSDAMITILKDSHVFSENTLKQIHKIREESDFKGNVLITPHGKGVEVIIRVPLQFRAVNISAHLPKKPHIRDKKAYPKFKVIKRSHEPEKYGDKGYDIAVPDLAF